MPAVTALRATRRGLVAVYVDGEFACAIGEAAVARWRLFPGRELAHGDLVRLAGEASRESALADAYRLLGHRARSTAELRRRLLAKDHAPGAVEAALDRLSDDGLLDDAAFARSYVTDKRRLAKWGAERIRRGLVEAGISPADADDALRSASAGDAEDAELQRALDILRRRGGQGGRPDDAARRRAYQLLLRRGFGSELAYAAVRAWVDAEATPGEPPRGTNDDL